MADTKPRWGRGAAAAAEIGSKRRSAGGRSVLFGLGALILLAGSLAVLAGNAGETAGGWATVRLLAALAAFFVAAPVLLAMGLAASLRGLFGAGGGRRAAAFGLLLNLALLGLGIAITLLVVTGHGRVS